MSRILSLTCVNKGGRFQSPGEALPLGLAHSATLVTLAPRLKHTGDSLVSEPPLTARMNGTTRFVCHSGSL